jgi:hypothetical protein
MTGAAHVQQSPLNWYGGQPTPVPKSPSSSSSPPGSLPGVTLTELVRARGGYLNMLSSSFDSHEVQLDAALEQGVLPGIAAGGASALINGPVAPAAERVQPGRAAVAYSNAAQDGPAATQQQSTAAKRPRY